MNELFTKLFDLLLQAWSLLVPWFILPDDACGLVRRLGVYHRDMRHGWNWKWPVIEQAMEACSAIDSYALREQSLTTKDKQHVTVRGVLTYRVVDARLWILAVNDPESVLNDAGCIAISELVPDYPADEVLAGAEFMSALVRRVRSRAKKFGLEIDAVGLCDRTGAMTLRLLGDK